LDADGVGAAGRWAPPVAAAAPAARVRAALARAGYTPEALAELRRLRLLPARAAARELDADRSPRATLLRLFLGGETVPAAEVEAALGPDLDAFAELDLVHEANGGLEARVELVPHDDLVIASDRSDLADDHDVVPGLHAPSATLGTLTIRRPVRRALDVGTGNGIQAILVAPSADRVVATDVNERALAFAQLNCALNARDNVELRLGSLLEPVAGERFGLVVANPPYVISPESRYVFRDSGMGGDRVSASLVADLPAHLEDGGHASVMISWIQEGDEIGPRVRSWVDGRGADALLLHAATTSASSAAAQWNRELADDAGRFDAAVDEWLAYFAAAGIEQIGYGTLVLRRRESATPWFAVLDLNEAPKGQASDQLLRLLASLDAVHLDDETLLRAVVAPVPTARLTRTLEPAAGGWRDAGAELVVADSVHRGARLDPATREVVLALDGKRTVGDVLAKAAVAAGASGDDAAQGLPTIRRLLAGGWLFPK
jgi:methylase of polypeptide subunit release factors